MKRMLLAATLLASIPLAANATLQLSGTISNGGTFNFSATDNNVGSHTLTDIDPTTNILSLGTTTIDGVILNGSLTTALLTGPFELNSSSLRVVNTNAFAVTLTGFASATDFIGPASTVSVSGSGTFQNAAGGTMINSWFDDPANGQGAPGTPGSLIFTSTPFTAVGSPSSYGASGFTFTGPVNDPGAFSETFAFTATLPGATIGSGCSLTNTVACPTLVGRQQAEEKLPGVPEPASLLILGMGLIGLSFVRRKGGAA